MKMPSTLLLICCLALYTSNAQTYQWAKSFGATDDDMSKSIAVDGSGNVYTTGFFTGTVDFDPGPGISNLTCAGDKDIFISKLDAMGNFLWAKSMGGINIDWGNSIALDGAGNVYTTGFFEGSADFDPGAGSNILSTTGVGDFDLYISKLDPAGNFVWAKSIGATSNDEGRSIAVDGAGNVYTTGYFQGNVDFDPGVGTNYLTGVGSPDIFISKLDAAGNFVWAKSMGGVASDWGVSIVVDRSGNIYTTGIFAGTGDFDPGPGSNNLASAGNMDIFISKLDASGNFIWAKGVGGTSIENSFSIAIDYQGNVYTTGFFEGTVDFDPGIGTNLLASAGLIDIFVLKLDTSGNFQWAKRMGGNSNDAGCSLALDGSGNVYTTGYFLATADFDPGPGTTNLTSAGLTDIFISKLDAAGNFIFAKGIGGNYADRAQAIAVDDLDNIYTTGTFSETADFDPGAATSNLTSAGLDDIFLLKLGQAAAGIFENRFENTLRIYPNPTKDALNIELDTRYDEVHVLIKNVLGQLVLKKSYDNVNRFQLSIPGDVGIYFMEVNYDHSKVVKKVLKE